VAHGRVLLAPFADPFEFAGPIPDKVPAVQAPKKGHLFFTTEAQRIQRAVAAAKEKRILQQPLPPRKFL
jgi:hypothetical protein